MLVSIAIVGLRKHIPLENDTSLLAPHSGALVRDARGPWLKTQFPSKPSPSRVKLHYSVLAEGFEYYGDWTRFRLVVFDRFAMPIYHTAVVLWRWKERISNIAYVWLWACVLGWSSLLCAFSSINRIGSMYNPFPCYWIGLPIPRLGRKENWNIFKLNK